MDSARTAAAEALSEQLGRHARLLHLVRAHLAAAQIPEGLDPATISLLLGLVKYGPRRQGELADHMLLDPSTVSRHVGQLVKAGFVERRPDPLDGRAVQLVATDPGTKVCRGFIEHRNSLVESVLAEWEVDEIEQLGGLLRRLNDSFEQYKALTARGTA